MQGCQYNCVVKSIVPEYMIEKLNQLYQRSEQAYKISEFQWILKFNREHCLTLRELLDFRQNGFIEIQYGQIALLMCRIIQKFQEDMIFDVIHGNLTFDNVWIINKSGFWPHNQKHNYEIVFVNYQGTSSDHQRYMEILLSLNDIIRPRENVTIQNMFQHGEAQLISNLVRLYGDIYDRIDHKTQTMTSWWFSDISIKDKYRAFADPNVFTRNLPLNNNLNQSNEDQQFNSLYLDDCNRIIIKKIMRGVDKKSNPQTINSKILASITKQIQLREDVIQFMTQRVRQNQQQQRINSTVDIGSQNQSIDLL